MLLDAVSTEGQMLGRMGPREQELWYLTQHFQDLQGLKIVAFFVAVGAVLLLPSRPVAQLVWATCGVLVLAAFGVVWLGGWYGVRYGLVRSGRTKPEMRAGFLPTYLFLFLAMLVLSLRSDVHGGVTVLWVSVMIALLPKCFFRTPKNVWVELRQWLYSFGVVGLTGLIGYAALGHVGHGAVRVILATYCVVFVLLGLYDHWLLGRLARPRGRVAVDAG